MPLTTQQLDHYCDQGFVVTDRIIDSDSLDALGGDLTARVDAVACRLRAEGRLSSLCEGEPFDKRLLSLFRAAKDSAAGKELWQAVELKYFNIPTRGMFQMMTHPALLDIVEQIIGPEIRFHPQSNARAKLPQFDASIVPWHQDATNLSPDSEKTFMINFWIPLVDVTMDMGGMQVMLGRHHTRPVISDTVFAIPDEKLPNDPIVDCPVRRGCALMIQKRTLHRSAPNTSEKVRWSLDFRYCDADLPAGRPGGFVARSRKDPARVINSYEQYLPIVPHLQTVWVS